MSNGNPNQLDEYLAGIYEILRRHEQTLFALYVQAQSLMGAIRECNPALNYAFEHYEREIKKTQAPAEHAQQLRLFDETIARLRGT